MAPPTLPSYLVDIRSTASRQHRIGPTTLVLSVACAERVRFSASVRPRTICVAEYNLVTARVCDGPSIRMCYLDVLHCQLVHSPFGAEDASIVDHDTKWATCGVAYQPVHPGKHRQHAFFAGNVRLLRNRLSASLCDLLHHCGSRISVCAKHNKHKVTVIRKALGNCGPFQAGPKTVSR